MALSEILTVPWGELFEVQIYQILILYEMKDLTSFQFLKSATKLFSFVRISLAKKL